MHVIYFQLTAMVKSDHFQILFSELSLVTEYHLFSVYSFAIIHNLAKKRDQLK